MDSEKRVKEICDKHGEYQCRVTVIFGRELKSHCPECSKERDAEEERRKLENEAAMKRLKISKMLGAAAIPKRFESKTFDDYKAETQGQQKALETVLSYAANFDTNYSEGRCLLLTGKPGTGKTHLAAALADWLIREKERLAVYRTVGGLLQEIRATYDDNSGPNESGIISAMVGADLLILDEIGANKTSEFELSTLFAVINGRYEQMRPTVVVSNLNAKDLAPAIGDRCLDRLREGGGISILFDWDSARKKAAK